MKLFLALVALGLTSADRSQPQAQQPFPLNMLERSEDSLVMSMVPGITSEDEAASMVDAILNKEAPPAGSQAEDALSRMTPEMVQQLEDRLKALDTAMTLMAEDDADRAMEEIAEINNMEPLTQKDVELINDMIMKLDGSPLSQTEMEILSDTNKLIESENEAGELENDDVPSMEGIMEEIQGDQTLTDQEKAAVMKELSDSLTEKEVPVQNGQRVQGDETPALTEQEDEALNAVLKSDMPAEAKAVAMAEIMDGEDMTPQEAEKLSQDLAGSGELDEENANIISAMEDEATMEVLSVKADEAAKAEVLEDVAKKTHDPKAVAEVMTGLDNDDIAEMMEQFSADEQAIIKQAEQVQADTASSEFTGPEMEAMVAVMEDPEMDRKQMEMEMAEIMDGAPLTQPQFQELERMMSGKMSAMHREVLQTMMSEDAVEKIDDAIEAAQEGDVMEAASGEAEDFPQAKFVQIPVILKKFGSSRQLLMPQLKKVFGKYRLSQPEFKRIESQMGNQFTQLHRQALGEYMRLSDDHHSRHFRRKAHFFHKPVHHFRHFPQHTFYDASAPENDVMHMIGQHKLRYLHEPNKADLVAYHKNPAMLKFLREFYGANDKSRISMQDWDAMFKKLSAYWKKALKTEIPIPIEEWRTVDTNKDGMIEVEGEILPTMLDMEMEPIFRVLASAYYYHFDKDQNGMLDKTAWASPKFAKLGASEWEYYRNHPAMKPFYQMPYASSDEVQQEVNKIEENAGGDAAVKAMDTLVEEGTATKKEQ